MRKYAKTKAAAVQADSVFMNVDASVEKACKLIRTAAGNGASYIVFPEAFLSGYPYWCWVDDPGSVMKYTQMLFAGAIECPGPELSKISECAKENRIYVCIGASEREQSTIYSTQFVFDDKGNMLGKHRKLKPMNSEKMIYGEGDASTMKVYDSPFGKIGALLSWEHMYPVNSMMMCSQREEVHAASFPALPKSPVKYNTFKPNYKELVFYAIANACFVICSTQVISRETVELISEEHKEYIERLVTAETDGIGGGNAFIMDPNGKIISNTIPEDQEGIVYADLDLSLIGISNFFMDTTGHYCNPAVFLEVDQTPQKTVRTVGNPQSTYITQNTFCDFD